MKMVAIPLDFRQSDPQLYRPSPPLPPRHKGSVNTALYVGIGQRGNTTGLRVATGVKGSSGGVCAKTTCTRVDFNGTVQSTKTNGTNVDIVG